MSRRYLHGLIGIESFLRSEVVMRLNREPWEAIDDELNKRIIIAHARPADVEAALRYSDRVAVGERLLLAYELAGKHRLPQEYELKEYLKRFFPAELDRLETEEEEEENDDEQMFPINNPKPPIILIDEESGRRIRLSI